MSDFNFGILTANIVLHELSKRPEPRTALLGQIIKIEGILGNGKVSVRFLKENETWETTTFYCFQERITKISEKLCHFLAAVVSPQERVKLAKNKSLCDELEKLKKDMTVGFKDTSEIVLGKIRFIGKIRGMGHSFGIELHEPKKNNKCDGSYAGVPYFSCRPGHGIFTTIEKIIPLNYAHQPSSSPPTQESELDRCLQKTILQINDNRPKNEEIITRYKEFNSKKYNSKPISNNTATLRNSLSLQNIIEADSIKDCTNTNNDFDQNTIIQPDKTYLINDLKKVANRPDVELSEVVGGSWHGNSYTIEKSNVKKQQILDRNENNVKEKVAHYSENGTISKGRNRSLNPISHLIDSNAGVSRSKFYTEEYLEPTVNKKAEKKLNEKSEQLARSSTFYVNNDTKSSPPEKSTLYEDPLPGTTNDLSIGSLVEVLNDVSEEPLYGVVRWLGAEKGSNFILVGVELEEEHNQLPLTLTDGTHNGQRFFTCMEGRALFVSLQQCHKDSRFQDGPPTPIQQTSAHIADCPVIPGAVAPLCMASEDDVEAVCGKGRGIQGHHNSCYLDVTLFAMFTYTAVFDSVLYRPRNKDDIAEYEEVQRVLREEIVNPLRKNLFVSADHVMKLRKLLDQLSSVSGLTSEEKDPEEFLNSLLAQILKAEPFLKLSSGHEAFHYQLFVEKDKHLTLPTVQQLFEQSFLTSEIKLKEVPSCLIIQMPRFGKSYKMYPRILPSQLLDVTDIIEGSPRQCIVCGKLAKYECRECVEDFNIVSSASDNLHDCNGSGGLASTAFCYHCLHTVHKHEKRQFHRPVELDIDEDYDFSSIQEDYRPPRIYMELFAVICIETSHYVAFVKCGVGHEAPWCFFDSMADRQGEKHGFNIPEMVACPDISRYLSDETICRQLHEDHPLDRHLPEHARRLLCDAYICMYQSSDVMMYR